MDRHGRGDLPFRRPRIPEIAFRLLTMLDAVEEIDNENQHGKRNEVTANRHDELGKVKPKRRIIIDNTAAHPSETNYHHSQSQDEERWRHHPEMDLAPEFIHTTACGFGKPVIDGSKKRKDEAAKNRIVKMT